MKRRAAEEGIRRTDIENEAAMRIGSLGRHVIYRYTEAFRHGYRDGGAPGHGHARQDRRVLGNLHHRASAR
jgi:hypothetical protein